MSVQKPEQKFNGNDNKLSCYIYLYRILNALYLNLNYTISSRFNIDGHSYPTLINKIQQINYNYHVQIAITSYEIC